MAPLSKKRKEIDLVEEDDVSASDAENGDEFEMHLQKMETLIAALRNKAGESAKTMEALMTDLLMNAKDLCETNAFNKSFRAIVDDIEDSDDDSSDDEAPIESITDEKEKRWEIMRQQLRQFRIINGHCNVPQRGGDNPKLGIWVNDQRRSYARGKTGKGKPMNPDRVAKLESLGFNWGKKYPPLPTWDEMFQKLKAYQKQTGHCNVPFNPTNPTPLAKWVVTQRREGKIYRNGGESLMTSEQFEELNEIGFKWKTPKKKGPKL